MGLEFSNCRSKKLLIFIYNSLLEISCGVDRRDRIFSIISRKASIVIVCWNHYYLFLNLETSRNSRNIPKHSWEYQETNKIGKTKVWNSTSHRRFQKQTTASSPLETPSIPKTRLHRSPKILKNSSQFYQSPAASKWTWIQPGAFSKTLVDSFQTQFRKSRRKQCYTLEHCAGRRSPANGRTISSWHPPEKRL